MGEVEVEVKQWTYLFETLRFSASSVNVVSFSTEIALEGHRNPSLKKKNKKFRTYFIVTSIPFSSRMPNTSRKLFFEGIRSYAQKLSIVKIR